MPTLPDAKPKTLKHLKLKAFQVSLKLVYYT